MPEQPDGAPRTDAGPVDAFRDCQAVCVRSASSPCECTFPCGGHLTTATCTATSCQCSVDGAPTLSFPYTICGPEQFIPGCHPELSPDAGTDAGHPDASLSAASYHTETRMIVSGGVMRSFVLATPTDIAARGTLPLVFSLHGDGGTGATMRTALPLEAHFQPTVGAVFVYPDAPGGSFEYWTYDGRTHEATFVTDVITALHAELDIDTSKVFIAGFSGGATMANALGCRLGPTVIRALGLHSGTLYPTTGPSGDDFTYTAGGGVSCNLPDALFVWGQTDTTSGVSYTDGQSVRDNYRATQSCAATTMPGPVSPCVSYDGCTHYLLWCPIPAMGHAIWPNAAEAMGNFWATFP